MSNIATNCAMPINCPANHGIPCFDNICRPPHNWDRHPNNAIIWSEHAFVTDIPDAPNIGTRNTVQTRLSQWRIALRLTALVCGLMFSLLFMSIVMADALSEGQHNNDSTIALHSFMVTAKQQDHRSSHPSVYQCALKILGSLNHSGSNLMRWRIVC